jgi:DNA polymerase I-like protein with 3'-5' exonuclease and polymerase domains
VAEDELEATNQLAQRLMRQAYELDVPLKTEAKTGPNWYEMRPLA